MEGDINPGAGSAAPAESAAPPAETAATEAASADLWASDPVAAATAEFEAALAAGQGDGGSGEGENAPANGQQQSAPGSESQQPPAGDAPDELTQLRAENERLKQSQPAPEPAPQVQRIRRFVGLDAIHEGGPTLDQLAQAIDRRDYAALNAMKRPDGTAGYSLEEALDLKASLEGNREIADHFAELSHGMAWGTIGSAFDEQVQSLGLDEKALGEEAAKAGDPLGVSKVYLSKIVEAARKAGRDEGSKEWKGKHDGLRAEFDSFKAQAAGNAPRLESGGRSNGKTSAAAVLALADDEYVERAIRGDFSGLDLSDN